MKSVLVFFAVVLVANIVLARPQGQDKDVQILRYENDNIGVGGYNFLYELSDGQSREETGELKNAGTENEAVVVRGSYKYTAPDGKVITVTYIADENGFQPQVSKA
ncbi:endocuticle structural glycoprotein SgAbd-5-like [Chrysoperla carnea]|uniref:endocuticle structural glycoprotein SgAbd-5-like n=1 Tax=Chrysoperla carnea TaxID=189513 RepID=UPI001D089C1C|nr:endocuticle structural glycoprotein SgAbd-5-like [Chrysoperla carnea]